MKRTLRYLLMLLAATLFAAPATDAQELNPVKNRAGRYGYADKSGKVVIACKYEKVWPFREGVAMVKREGEYTFINTSGRIVTPFRYEEAKWCSDGLIAVRPKYVYKWGYVNALGEEIIPPGRYSEIGDFVNGMAKVSLSYSKWGYINTLGEEVVPCKYQEVGEFINGLAKVRLDLFKWGYVNFSGEEVIPCKYQEIGDFVNGLAKAKLAYPGGWGYINTSSEEVIPCKYQEIGDFVNGLAKAKLAYPGGWGYINTSGEEVIPCKYQEIGDFVNGLAKVSLDYFKWGYVNTSGEEVVPCKYDEIGNFVDGLAKAKLAYPGGWGYINSLGEEIIPCIHDYVDDFSEGLVAVKNDGRWGFVSTSGEVIIPYRQYTSVNSFKDGLVRVWTSKETSRYIDHQGNWYKTRSEGEKAIANNPLLAMHKGYLDENKVTTPATHPPIAQPQHQPQVEVPVYTSVDADIPVSKVRNDKTFAVIVANENYRREQGVEFAKNDGEVFRNYCERTLGIPVEHIHLLCDATLNDLHAEIDWLCRVAQAYRGEAKIIFYYAGHGIPDNSSRTAYLLPVDGYGDNVVTGYRVQELYDRLSALPTQRALVLLDACFSGAQRDGKMMASARGIAIAPEPDAPKGNLIVFSATQGDQTAYPYREMKHGMFTYFLLKKLQETRGEVTLGELTSYVSQEVERRSIVVNRKDQTPTVVVGEGLASAWNEMLF